MRTRPVFESYTDFVNALYEMENEIPGFIDGLDNALNEGWVPKEVLTGKTESLPSIISSFGKLVNGSGSGFSKDDTGMTLSMQAATFLQVAAAANPNTKGKLQEIGDYLSLLLTKDWINTNRSPRLETASDIFPGTGIRFNNAEGFMVQVTGAPDESCTSIASGVQTISAIDLCGRIAAYNASIQLKAFKTFMKSLDKESEFKRAIKGDLKANWFSKIFGKQDIDGAYESGSMSECLYIVETGSNKTGGILKVQKISQSKSSTFKQALLTDKGASLYGHFKYPFPVISFYQKGGGSPLSVETRTKLIPADKTKKTEKFDDVISVAPPDEKLNFYVVNKADMTEEGKAAIAGIINQFAKIDELEIMGSADNRKPTGWKDNNELATARRDVTVKYLQELAKQEGTSLTGATIKPGKVEVQPAGQTTDYAKWRNVKIKPSGEIYSELKDALDNADSEDKIVSYTEEKRADQINFYNFTYCLAFKGQALDEKGERKKSLQDKSDLE